MAIKIMQATISQADKIMEFIHNKWKANHILSKNKDFFLYEFQNKDLLNIIIAKNEYEEIIAFFGYFYYNLRKNPDMAGSIWKVDTTKTDDQMLGLKIRNFFVDKVKPNFFATPGPGIHMKNVYKVMRMTWQQMGHFYIANANMKSFALLKNPKIKTISALDKTCNNKINITKLANISDKSHAKEIQNFLDSLDVAPLKDLAYIKKRFFEHPIYKYDVYYLRIEGAMQNIFVCREAKANGAKAYRIVDFYGELSYMKYIVAFLYEYIQANFIEYFDFICFGYDDNALAKAGFNRLDFKSDTIVPNYFEPFVMQNVPVYCVSDKTNKIYRQHKADGDMDRPNSLN